MAALSLKTSLLISFIPTGIATLNKPEHPINCLIVNEVTPPGIDISVSDTQLPNATFPIDVIESGKAIVVKELQPSKTPFPMIVTLFGTVIEVILSQSRNAPLSNFTTAYELNELGIIIPPSVVLGIVLLAVYTLP